MFNGPELKALRAEAPGGEGKRREFQKYAEWLQSYSLGKISPEEAELFGEEIRSLLRKEIEELKMFSPLIRLRYELEKNGFPQNVRKILIEGVFGSPSLKELNDKLLGYAGTDSFLLELHKVIREIFADNGSVTLHQFFKGGSFLVNAHQSELTDPIVKLQKLLSTLQNRGEEILMSHLQQRKSKLSQKGESKENLLACLYNAESKEDLQALADKGFKADSREDLHQMVKTPLEQDLYDMANNLNEVVTWLNKASEEEIFRMRFGAAKLPDVKGQQLSKLDVNKELSISLMKAKIAANMASLSEGEESSVKAFKAVEFFLTLMDLRLDLQSKTQENPELYDKFFVTNEAGAIEMRPEVIRLYRKKYFPFGKNLHTNWEKYSDCSEAVEFFKHYYKRINVVDCLKPFRVENFEAVTLPRINKIIQLINQAEAALNNPTIAISQLQEYLRQTSKELELSLKNENNVERITHTTRALVKHLLETDESVDCVIAFADLIGCGANNISAMEQQLIQIINPLMNLIFKKSHQEVTYQDFKENIEPELTKKESSFEALFNKPNIAQSLWAIGDIVTEYIRRQEEKLQRTFGDNPATMIGSGGDELTGAFNRPQNNKPRSLSSDENSIHGNSNGDLRLYVEVLGERFQLNPSSIISELNRKLILTLMQMQDRAEKNHEQQKTDEIVTKVKNIAS